MFPMSSENSRTQQTDDARTNQTAFAERSGSLSAPKGGGEVGRGVDTFTRTVEEAIPTNYMADCQISDVK